MDLDAFLKLLSSDTWEVLVTGMPRRKNVLSKQNHKCAGEERTPEREQLGKMGTSLIYSPFC